MSISPMKINKEKGDEGEAIGGSLGALVTSYAVSSSSDEETVPCQHPSGTRQMRNDTFKEKTTSKPELLVENPLHEYRPDKVTEIMKEGQVDSSNHDKNHHKSCLLPIGINKQSEIKKESIDNHEQFYDTPDFATLNEETGVYAADLELKVGDFFTVDESYSEARTVKVEIESSTDSESECEDTDSLESEDEIGSSVDQDQPGKGKRKSEGLKVKGELSVYDLPPIEDLHITVPHEECKPIGVIKSVVEPLVLVEALPETPALDLDSVLFLEEGDRALGHIFDVIGQVKQPIYCVRFNSKEHIEKNNIQVGMSVYCAPKTPYTSYVFLAQLRRLKGSDASWLNDIEPPVEEVEFSDDEMERISKKKKRNRKLLKARATEKDALYKEDSESGETRGKKRHHNFNGQQTGCTGTQYGPGNSSNSNGPFIPIMVPGFSPRGPPFIGGCPSGNWFPGANHVSQHRGRGGRGFQRFRPPLSGPGQPPGYYNGFQRQPSEAYMASWRPPTQWQNPNMADFNFGGNPRNPYIYPNMYGFSPTHPPPPPPPPPPGQ